MSDVEEFNRMRWASRRGLLELDLLLAPFVDACYRELDRELQVQFQSLVQCEDQDILNWLMARDNNHDPALGEVLAAIRSHNDAKAAP
ncbi:TPR repeat region superfamily protein [Luminiphilus syltensis NOR5-1B]|uniref:FAD assembly factor SdhE n=1 Tax=Luminiphilus syltensis NOR5-1B TaxID=565045 RepID=B8KR25_9GAMM|nr:succinate dehydrogenase assembly factor 2 [Luminiphilus syltensis]EED35081.1 TPR repeat region superfamily protein [Luminiphilus syltensis NOR5-1B]